MRNVNEKLNVREDFPGFYELDNIRSFTIVNAIKDILHRFNLNLEDCRGQTYDGANNMLEQHSGVATQTLAEEPKAVVTHCHGHSLSLPVKFLTSNCNILKDSMSTAGEICILIKCSPKREKVLRKIVENIEGDLSKELWAGKISKLSTTRCTVRTSCFPKIIDNFVPTFKLWEQCLNDFLEHVQFSGFTQQTFFFSNAH